MKNKLLSIGNIAGFIILLIFNTLTGIGLINKMSQKEISDMFPTALTPDPYVFSIWGLIYLLLAITILVMYLGNRNEKMNPRIRFLTILLVISHFANTFWTISFAYLQIGLSTLIIFILLICLTEILKILSKEPKVPIVYSITFGIYAGWVLIATVLNISVFLVQIGWNGFGISERLLAQIVLIVSMIIVTFVTTKTKSAFLPLPVAWASFAIYTKFNYFVAFGCVVFCLLLCLFQFYKNGFKLQ